jgi:hypothetical protein
MDIVGNFAMYHAQKQMLYVRRAVLIWRALLCAGQAKHGAGAGGEPVCGRQEFK